MALTHSTTSAYRILVVISLLYNLSFSTVSLTNDDIISAFSESSLLTNEYESDNDSYWRSKSYFQPVNNASFGSITMRNSFYMKFNMIWHGFSSNNSNRPFEGIFRIGIKSTNIMGCDGHASRYPALYIDRKKKSLQFSVSDNIDCWGVGLLNVSYHKLQMNKLYNIGIQYDQESILIRVNEEILYNDRRPGITPSDILNTRQSIMISDAIDPPANVTLSDIIIISYNNQLSLYPTVSPTQSPLVSLSTNVPTLRPILTATTSSTSSSTMDTTKTSILSTINNYNQTFNGNGDGDDTFVVNVVIVISVIVQNDNNNNQTFNNSIISTIIQDQIFPDTNLTNFNIDIDTKYDDIIINMTIPIENKQELNRLTAYLKQNLTVDLMDNMQHSLPNTQILEIHYEIYIKEIYIQESSDDSMDNLDSNEHNNNNKDLLALLPFNQAIVLYIVIGAVSLCICSFILCVCICCKYCKLRHKMKMIENQDRDRTGSILSIQNVKPQKIIKKISAGDGYDGPQHIGRTSTIDECMEENPIAMIHEMQELKRLSHSHSGSGHDHNKPSSASRSSGLPSVYGNNRTSPGSGSNGSGSNPSGPSNESGDMDELSLGTHVIHTSEGGEKLQNLFYQAIQQSLPPPSVSPKVNKIQNDNAASFHIDQHDDDLNDERCHILALPSLHAVESAKSVNSHESHMSDATFIIRNLSNLNMLNQSSNHSNLDVMIEDQIKITNRYCSVNINDNDDKLDINDDWNEEEEDDDDDLAELQSVDSSSNEAMYDEGLRRGSSINMTKTKVTPFSSSKKINGLPPPHQSMQ